MNVSLATKAFGASFATSPVGPGTLALLTGDFQVGATDVSMPAADASLAVGRTLTTLADPSEVAGASGVFGPAWSASLPGFAGTVIDDESAQGYLDLTGSDGSVDTFTPTATPGTYQGFSDAAATGATLVKTSSSIVLSEPDGSQTTWTGSGTSWALSTVKVAGSTGLIRYGYSGGLLTRITAPAPAGVDCLTAPDTTAGCRSLTFSYAYPMIGGVTVNRLQTVTFHAWDPQAAAMASVDVAGYDYDTAGRLAHAWDPRISPTLKTAYGYDATGRLTTITPPGLAAWSLHYDASHRLSSITRPDTSGATATSTIVYGVAVSGTGAPVDVSQPTAAQWGQTSDNAVTGTAVFGPNRVPSSPPSNDDWPYASLTYLDTAGRPVNSASYGAGQWLVDSARFDQHGNQVWSLTAANRAQALSPTPDTDPVAAAASGSADAANLLATSNSYSADGAELLDSLGPIHPVQQPDGSRLDAREHSHVDYDQGAPASGGPYELPTTVTASVQDVNGVDYQARITRNGYAVINANDPNEESGWEARQPTTVTTQMGSSPSAADLVSTTRYNHDGQVIESRLPSGPAGGTATSTTTSYYTPGSSGTCVSNMLAGLVCSTAPAAQPTTGNPLPVTTASYNLYNQPLTITETAGSTMRTTSSSYDSADRLTGRAVSVTPTAAGGTALPAMAISYDSTTGLPTTVTAGGQSLSTGYDNLGRVTAYTDATGNITTTSYDLASRPVSVNDGKGSTSYTYDTATEHRGLVTSEDIGASSAPGSFTAAYDPNGGISSLGYPSGLTATTDYDNAGHRTTLSYSQSGTSWLSFTQTPGADGNTAAQSSPQSSQTFSYDNAGRLATTQDSLTDASSGTISCTTRTYTLDRNSNRTNLASYPDDGTNPTTGNCTTATSPTSWRGSYDQADRLIDPGYSYDSLGRTTALPAADAQGQGSHTGTTGPLAIGYYANDLVASEIQAGRTLGFSLDPLQNRILATTDTAGATSTNHYANNGDSPAWTSTPTTWTRNITGPAGDLTATIDQTGTVTLQLANLHGDIIATADDDPAAIGPNNYTETTEYGTPRTPNTAPDTYGWLGTQQRSTNDLAGLTLMGIRLYNPTTGRFLTTDPIPGGNDNPYVYVTNPIDGLDLDGGRGGYNGRYAKCKGLGLLIRKMENRIQRRARQLEENAHNWAWDTAERLGHYEAFQNDQRGLRNLLNEWDSCGCGGGGGGTGRAWSFATQPYQVVAGIRVMGEIVIGIVTLIGLGMALA